MSEIKTYTDYLVEVIMGKVERYKCSGFMSQQPHEIVEYEVIIGERYFSYSCPKCGYGSGGGISMEDRDSLLKLIMEKEKHERE